MEHPVDDHTPKVAEEEVRHPLGGLAGDEHPQRVNLPDALQHGPQCEAGGGHGGEGGGGEPVLVVPGDQLVSLLLEEPGVPGQEKVEPLQRRVLLASRHTALHIGVQRGESLDQQRLLGGEVMVKGPGGNARPAADVPDGNLVEAALPGELGGGV